MTPARHITGFCRISGEANADYFSSLLIRPERQFSGRKYQVSACLTHFETKANTNQGIAKFR